MAGDTTWPALNGLHPDVDLLGRPWYLTDLARRTLVTEVLSSRGVSAWRASIAVREFARGLADGFGPLDESMPGYTSMLWDWSHVRDSSPAAFVRMYDYLVAEKVLPLTRTERENAIAGIVVENGRITADQARVIAFLCGDVHTFRTFDAYAGSGTQHADAIGAYKVRQARNMRVDDRPVFFDALQAMESLS